MDGDRRRRRAAHLTSRGWTGEMRPSNRRRLPRRRRRSAGHRSAGLITTMAGRRARISITRVSAPDGTRTETQVATNVCFCCKAAIVTDADSRSSIAWRHIYPNNMRDIAFRTIGGAAPPTDAVRISEDQWQLAGCPDDGPAMVKEDAGRIHVVWPTLGQRRHAVERHLLRFDRQSPRVLGARAARRRHEPGGIAPATHARRRDRPRRAVGRAG